MSAFLKGFWKNCRGGRKHSHKPCEGKEKFLQWKLCESCTAQFIRKKIERQLWLEWVRTLTKRNGGGLVLAGYCAQQKRDDKLETSAQMNEKGIKTREVCFIQM